MKIRSITFFLNPEWPLNEDEIKRAGEFIHNALPAFEQAGYEVQTTRLATIPFPRLFNGLNNAEIILAAKGIEKTVLEQGFDYAALGPAVIDRPESYAVIPELIAATEIIFCCGEIATHERGVSLAAVRACAEIIHSVAPLDPNGFANLYFTAIANVEPGSPFFPAAYHDGGQPRFAIATEAASLAVEAFTNSKSLGVGIKNLIASIEKHSAALNKVAEDLAGQSGVPFGGIDFSLAPFPEEASSLGTAIERIGVPAVGLHGSLAAAAVIADALDKADIQRVGFSGLLFPQLEDSTLAARAEEGYLTVKDLLMYSAVCGTGLDTIPIPGETSPEEIAPLLLDLSALALRLDKPLSARIMPVPGKQAGELTTFEFDFFANSRVMALEAKPLEGNLIGKESFSLQPKKKE